MGIFRQRRARIAAIWLTCQAAAVGLAPALLACQMCPLHKHDAHDSRHASAPASTHAHHHEAHHHDTVTAQQPAQPSENDCGMRSTCDPLTLAIQALMPSAGILPQVDTLADDLNVRALTAFGALSAPSRTTAPDLPPPRA